MSSTEEEVEHLHPFFGFVEKEFTVDSFAFPDIVMRYGTPIMIFSKARLVDNAKHFAQAFQKHYSKTIVTYSMKANYLPRVCRVFQELGFGAEVLSEFEYAVARKVGFSSEQIMFNGIATPEEYEKIVEDNIMCFNVQSSISELKTLQEISNKHNVQASVGIRVHPVLGQLEKDALFQEGFKLGMSIQSGEAMAVFEYGSRLKNLEIAGIHMHSYVRRVDPSLHLKAIKSMVDFVKKLKKEKQIELRYLDIGGGYGTRALMESQGSNVSVFAEKIAELIGELDYEPCLVLEPGRYLVNDAGIVLSRVITRRSNTSQPWIIVDIGTNVLIPLKNAEYRVFPARYVNDRRIKVSVGDRISSSFGIIETDAIIPEVKEGDIVVVLNCGAYTVSLAEQFVYPRCGVLMSDEGKIEWINNKETAQEMVNGLVF